MSLKSLEQQLALLEEQFSTVSASLIGAEPTSVESASAKLQQLAVDFLEMADALGRNTLESARLGARIQALAEGMPHLRANLLRRTVYVERALELLVPREQKSTYAETNGLYGNALRQSGHFKAFTA